MIIVAPENQEISVVGSLILADRDYMQGLSQEMY